MSVINFKLDDNTEVELEIRDFDDRRFKMDDFNWQERMEFTGRWQISTIENDPTLYLECVEWDGLLDTIEERWSLPDKNVTTATSMKVGKCRFYWIPENRVTITYKSAINSCNKTIKEVL